MLNILKKLFFVILILCSCTYFNYSNTVFINIDTVSNNIKINKNQENNYDSVLQNFENNKYNLTKNKQKSKEVIRILSLDGGGTRAYLQAKFLEKFCQYANIENINEYFDLIVCTSAGSLNGITLANGIKPVKMQKFFREIGPWIFTIRSVKDIFSKDASVPSNKPNTFQKLLLMTFSNPFYKADSKDSNYGDAILRKTLTGIFENKLLQSIKTKIVITAYNDSKYYPMIFTNAELNNIPNIFKDVKIVDAVMATISFPIYFPSTNLCAPCDNKLPVQKIVDGGLFQRNPSLLAFTIANELYPSAKKYCLLSVGTGIGRIGLNTDTNEPEPSTSSLSQYMRLYDIVTTNSDITNDIFLKQISKSNTNSNLSYYRFNILFNNKNFDKDDMDTSTPEFFDYLDEVVTEQYENDKSKINEFIKQSDFYSL
ncbi:MAG: patatin-like phospholipase family protein [Alphaproteobacteria bacterium]|nr:patatin-like phospholipase family protein [Alphaproteobacteria bacterium]